MSEDIKKTGTDNKIVSFDIKEEDMQDSKMDRFVRESLIREADELEKEIEGKPELSGLGAPDSLFESIVGELKESGAWEEDSAAKENSAQEKAGQGTEEDSAEGKAGQGAEEDSAEEKAEHSADKIYAQLSEEDQKALALGRELVQRQEVRAKKSRRRRKLLKIFAISAACLGVIFGVSMTSAANRRLVKRMWDGLMVDLGFNIRTNYAGDEETVRSKSKEEMEAMEEIKEKTGAPLIEFGYFPKGMKYQGYEITNKLETIMFYQYQDTIFYVTMMDADREGAYYYMYDNDAEFQETVVNETGVEAKIWEVNLELEEETYIAELEYGGWRYILNGMISLEEMRNIIEYSLFL